ncbi:helix-turn-helix transcriptional regulator [Streptomyces sp. ISL-11]|uniref:helix-turn-helix domain-containing protein n=1 Tax=Streptomyces sp. ISL-11 TaxID=2819174 RepID=UPI001BE5E483|nr:helix-turn-helix transcriptional regulator [Streptomyces sp. ISL-11]MBT2383795.1 helix-turn-helix domain-containing protein [Streptomyces sp. ISL-11]
MPPISTPTVRQRRLGAELRKLREAAGISTQEAAALLGVNRTRIPNIEAGRFRTSPERVRTLATNYGCTDTQLVEALVDITKERGNHWWESYRELLPPAFLDVAELEHHATAMRMFVMVHIPGLLQTAEHARAVFESSLLPLARDEVELRAMHRMRRQEVLTLRRNPPKYTAIVHEAALHIQFGGPKVAREQLNHLLDISERDNNVTIRAIPFGADGFAGPGQPIFYANGPVPQLDTVQLDSFHGSTFIDSHTDLADYRALLDKMEALCLPENKTRDLIHGIAQKL